ncbi:MAG: hypothetical protein WED04_07275 [Promethearchaeati archaeon SRVP18_Atabeyarchaeia-1]
MTSSDEQQSDQNGSTAVQPKGEAKDLVAALSSQLAEIKVSLERLTKSVGELNSKMRSTGDVMKWVLDALSRRSEDKEVLYLKNFEASTELLMNFMAFVESRVKPLSKAAQEEAKELEASKKGASVKEAATSPPKKGEEYLVKPSLVRKFQEEEGKEKDRKSR